MLLFPLEAMKEGQNGTRIHTVSCPESSAVRKALRTTGGIVEGQSSSIDSIHVVIKLDTVD